MRCEVSERNRIKFANGEHRTRLRGSKCCIRNPYTRTESQTSNSNNIILCNQQIWIPFAEVTRRRIQLNAEHHVRWIREWNLEIKTCEHFEVLSIVQLKFCHELTSSFNHSPSPCYISHCVSFFACIFTISTCRAIQSQWRHSLCGIQKHRKI